MGLLTDRVRFRLRRWITRLWFWPTAYSLTAVAVVLVAATLPSGYALPGYLTFASNSLEPVLTVLASSARLHAIAAATTSLLASYVSPAVTCPTPPAAQLQAFPHVSSTCPFPFWDSPRLRRTIHAVCDVSSLMSGFPELVKPLLGDAYDSLDACERVPRLVAALRDDADVEGSTHTAALVNAFEACVVEPLCRDVEEMVRAHALLDPATFPKLSPPPPRFVALSRVMSLPPSA